VCEAVGDLRLFRKKEATHVVGDVSEDALRVAIFAAENPFRLVSHAARLTEGGSMGVSGPDRI
jgi:hypothetical protein